MEPIVISKRERKIVYGFAIGVDAVQAVLAAFVVSEIANHFIDIIVGAIILVYGMRRKLWSGNKLLVLLAYFIGEQIPFVNAFPFWTLDIKNMYKGTINEFEAANLKEEQGRNEMIAAAQETYVIQNGMRQPKGRPAPVNREDTRPPGRSVKPSLLSEMKPQFAASRVAPPRHSTSQQLPPIIGSQGKSNQTEFSSHQLQSLQKNRPSNTSSKRFVLSSEAFSQERMEGIKRQMSEIKEIHPEVLSFSMFGSMVKGTAHQQSDIDGYLFVDAAQIAKKEKVSEDELLENTEAPYFREDISRKYSLELKDGLKEKLKLTDEMVGDIKSRPISEKIIDQEVNRLTKYQQERDQYGPALDKWYESKPPEGSSPKTILDYQQQKPKSPQAEPSTLSEMFHLEVGGGIKKYRKILIDKLAARGEEGEKVWIKIIREAELMENNLSQDPTKRYPRTLSEAKALYGR